MTVPPVTFLRVLCLFCTFWWREERGTGWRGEPLLLLGGEAPHRLAGLGFLPLLLRERVGVRGCRGMTVKSSGRDQDPASTRRPGERAGAACSRGSNGPSPPALSQGEREKIEAEPAQRERACALEEGRLRGLIFLTRRRQETNGAVLSVIPGAMVALPFRRDGITVASNRPPAASGSGRDAVISRDNSFPRSPRNRWYAAVTPLDATPASVTSAMIASKNTLTSRPSLLGECASEFETNVTPAKLTQPPVHRRIRRQAGFNHVDAGE